MLAGSMLHAAAQRFNFRHYQVEQGLSNNTVICSVQDNKGFMWFGTKDGLNRFDGYSFKTFYMIPGDSKSIGTNFIESLYEDERGMLWAGTEKGLFGYDKITETFTPLKGDIISGDVSDIKSDRKGNLWIINIPELMRYDMRTGQVVNYSSKYHFEPTSISIDGSGKVFVSAVDNSIREFVPSADSFLIHILPSGCSQGFPAHELNTIYCTGGDSILVGTLHHGLKLFDYRKGECSGLIDNDRDNPEIFVRNILQVSPNKVWVASESGIFIYDRGLGVVNLKKQYNDPYSISDNAVYCLCRDKEGGIWAGTYFGGVNYFANSLVEFDKFFPGKGENSLSGNAVREICKDRYNNLWIGTEDAGLNKIDAGTGLFHHFVPTGQKGSIAYYNIHALLPDGDRLWIGSFLHGLDVMDIPSGTVVKHYSGSGGKYGFSNEFIYSLAKTREGIVLAGTSAGLYSYNEGADHFELANWVPAHDFVTAIYPDSKGGIWVGTFREGVFYRSAGGSVVNLRKTDDEDRGLTSDRINGIFEDSRGLFWITSENGLCCYDPAKGSVRKYTTLNGLPGNVTYKVLEDDRGDIWVSTSKGLVNLNRKTGAIRVYTKSNGLLSDQFNYSSAFKDEAGNMYFGSVKGMIRFNPAAIRKNAFNPPVFLTGFQVNNTELPITTDAGPLEHSITYTEKISLAYNQSSISIDFSAISFTAPEMTQYAYKLDGLENDWTYLKSNRKIYFTNLPPGDYRLLVKAMNSNGIWSENPGSLRIVIRPPFWKSPVAYGIYVLFLGWVVWYLIRSYHRQVQLRNQRKIELLENEKAKEIYHAKIEFFTNVAHEIRTPLTLIKLPLEKILSMPQTDEAKRNLAIMEKNTDRLIDLTNQLLDFRKIENNSLSLSYVKTDVSGLVEEVYTAFKPAAEQKGMQFRLEMPRMHFQAYIDPEAVRKIISNLLSNAIKYGEQAVKIKILPFSSEDEFFSIRVSNDGRIIPREMRERIFEPFFRLKETQKEPGTGIGLALSLSLAQLHKGTLSVDADEAQNSFTVTLPIHQETEFELYKEEVVAAPVREEMTEEGDHRQMVLLVEDNQEILDFVAGELKGEYSILKARNGVEALKKIETEHVQLIISDVMMPVMDGYSLCKEVKSNVEYSHIPVILLTAKNSLQSKIEGLEMGADAYIEKPFSQQYLLAQIKSLLNNRNKIKEHFANSPLVNIKTMAYSKADERFLTTISEIIQGNLASAELNVDLLAREMNMSRPTLYRKIKGLSNLSPNDLIKITRLKKAAELLGSKQYKIYEVAGMVGYSLAANFSRDFMKQFGISPTEYAGERIG
ncbi:MAG: response regulator [Bacteroidetes bacterium]|nr:response regulator [Bacteroidota bacterium]